MKVGTYLSSLQQHECVVKAQLVRTGNALTSAIVGSNTHMNLIFCSFFRKRRIGPYK